MLEPPVLVTIEMMPDLALPNSADEDPVVTEASSNALVPTLISSCRGAGGSVAAVSGLHRHAVDVGGRFTVAAAADRKAAVVVRGHARLELQHLVDAVDRQLVGELAVDPLLGGHLVPRHQRLGLGDDRDLLNLDRRLLQLHVHRDGLVRRGP